MPLIVAILIACILAGLAVWILQSLVADPKIVQIGRVAIVVLLVLWLLSAFFGMPTGLGRVWGARY